MSGNFFTGAGGPSNTGTGFSGLITGVGTAVGDALSAAGDLQAASDYGQAATLATQDATLSQQATKIQTIQAQRQISQTIGSQRAEVAGAGFAESGSSLNLLASSAQQGAMTTALIGVQGQITANGYSQQAAAYTAEEDAAKSAATVAEAGAATAGASAIAALIPFSSQW